MDVNNARRDTDIESLKAELMSTRRSVQEGKELRTNNIDHVANNTVTGENNKRAIVHLAKLATNTAWDSVTLFSAMQSDMTNVQALTRS